MPLIYLFRKAISSDPYERLIERQGGRVKSIQVLDFAFVNSEKIRASLLMPQSYSGVILTSRRAVQAIEALVKHDPGLLKAWRNKRVYVVGPATGEAARRVGLRPLGAETGSGAALASLIAQIPVTKPYLFLCGNRRREEFPTALSEACIPLEEIEGYRTIQRKGLELYRLERPDLVVFFSPSGVDTVHQAWPATWNNVAKVAIGSTTAEALKEAGWIPDGIAEEPSPEGLIATLSTISGPEFGRFRS